MLIINKGRIRVVIIDNGFNKSIYYELTGKMIETYSIEKHKDIVVEGDTEYYGLSHGTVCAAILTEFAEDAEVIGISLADSGELPLCHLEAAIFWCLNHSVDVICMSIGITAWLEISHLLPLFELLAKSHIIVVAAAANDGQITYPASLSSVLGVRYRKVGSEALPLCSTIIDNPVDGIDIETDLPESVVLYKLRERFQFRKTITNSMVTPYIAARIIEFIKKGYPHSSLGEVKQSFVKYMGAVINQGKDDTSSVSTEELLLRLENLPYPVIGLVYGDEQGGEAVSLIVSLQKVFYRNGFSAVIFSPVLEHSVERNIYRLDDGKTEEELVRYTKLISTDLILLYLPNHKFKVMKNISFIDFLVEYNIDWKSENSTEYGKEYMTECNLTECLGRDVNRMYILSSNTETVEIQAEAIYVKGVELFC